MPAIPPGAFVSENLARHVRQSEHVVVFAIGEQSCVGGDHRSANLKPITFTELAAGALGARVHRYVDELLAGQVPEPLQPALPEGLTDAQRQALIAQRKPFLATRRGEEAGSDASTQGGFTDVP